jgi:hypothetical protein
MFRGRLGVGKVFEVGYYPADCGFAIREAPAL